MRLLLTLTLAALSSACTITNTAHCGNQSGNATCYERDPQLRYCNICVADNNGCVAPEPIESCLAATDPPVPEATTTTLDPTSTTDPGTTVIPKTTESNPATTATTSDPTTDPQTTTVEPETTGTTTTGKTETSTSSTGPDTDGTSETTTTGDTDTASTTMPVPMMCGNNIAEGTEECDGTDLNEVTCKTVIPGKWGNGVLTCNEGCMSFNDTNCCFSLAQKCNPLDAKEKCCPGLQCQLNGLQGYCKSK